MNGARSTFMRTGYWLTALAAIVLLAASAGTASAQITAKVDKEVAEGDSVSITFTAKATIEPGDDAGSITVVVGHADTTAGASHEGEDVVGNPGTAELRFPAGEDDEDGAENKLVTVTGTAVLQTTHDPDAEDETVILIYTFEAGGLAPPDGQEETPQTLTEPANGSVTIKDAQTQNYVLTLSSSSAKAEEGDDVTVSLKADPAHVDDAKTLTLNLDRPAPDYSFDITNTATDADITGSVVTIGASDATPTPGITSATITIDTDDEDGNRDPDTVTLTVYSGRAGSSNLEDSLAIKLTDKDALPLVAMMVVEDGKALALQPTSVTEGDTIMVAVMVVDEEGDETNATEDLDVALTATGMADSADYTLTGSFDIESGMSMSDAVELEVSKNDDIGEEMLRFDAVVSGDPDNGPGTRMSPGVLSLSITDDTTPLITPKTSTEDYDAIKAVIAAAAGDDGLNPDPAESFTLTFSDLFDLKGDYTATYSFSQAGTSVSTSSDGESITVTAEMVGRTEITINGTARLPVSSLEGSQTVANDASIKFPVDVVDTELVVMLSAEPMEIEEGGTTMITATANRYVTANDGAVAIALTVVGDGTLDANSIMIAMGDMSGSAVLTSTADDDMDNETVTVVATGSGVTGLMQVAVAVTDTTEPVVPEPVPALPLIAQWLLGLGLLGGGARQLFRRRRQG